MNTAGTRTIRISLHPSPVRRLLMKSKLLIGAAGLAMVLVGAAHAQVADGVVKIGVLTDLSGAYSDLSGQGSVVAVQMAIGHFVARANPPFKVEMVYADHQNKGDIAANKAREWFERDGVDMVMDLVTSSTALAVMKIGKEKDKIVLVNGAGSTRITNEDCNDGTGHWGSDTHAGGH